MRAPIFQIDAFTTRRFAGNPAAVDFEVLSGMFELSNPSSAACIERRGVCAYSFAIAGALPDDAATT